MREERKREVAAGKITRTIESTYNPISELTMV
jgi:hypothetical protein